MYTIYSQFPHFNRDFRVKCTTAANTRGRLVGLRGFVAIVGNIELATRIYKRAQSSRGDKFTAKLRRGVLFHFYVK